MSHPPRFHGRYGALCVLSVSLLSACSIALRHGELLPPPSRRTEQVWASWRAEGRDVQRVGTIWFVIVPLDRVEIDGSARELVGSQVREALEHVGYRVSLVNSYIQPAHPTVTCSIEQFWFSGQTMIFPLVPVWGAIELLVTVRSPAGRPLWSRKVRGSGLTLNFFDGFNVAASQAMTEILNQLVGEFSSEDFHRVISGPSA